MNAGFDENESELAVFVFAIALEVLADGDSLGVETSETVKSHLAVSRLDQDLKLVP